MAEWLLNHGANADAKDRLRFKPVDYVVGATNDALAALLQQHMKSRLDQSLPSKVGEAGDPDRLLRGFADFHQRTDSSRARDKAQLPARRPSAGKHARLPRGTESDD